MKMNINLDFLMVFGVIFEHNNGKMPYSQMRLKTFTIDKFFTNLSTQFGSKDIGLLLMIWSIKIKTK